MRGTTAERSGRPVRAADMVCRSERGDRGTLLDHKWSQPDNGEPAQPCRAQFLRESPAAVIGSTAGTTPTTAVGALSAPGRGCGRRVDPSLLALLRGDRGRSIGERV